MSLLNELKEFKQNKCISNTRPEVVDNTDNPDDIVDSFEKVYSMLYNSSPSDMSDVLKEVIVKSEDLIEDNKITKEVVMLAVTKMKKGKNDVSGSFSSVALLNAPEAVFDSLAVIFKSYLIHGTITKPMLG